MLITALVAFGHFFAFFALTAALVLQLTLLTDSISLATARRIQRADQVYGLMAVLVLVFGFLRVFYFEKSADYYFNNDFFLLKMSLLVVIGLISIYPTVTYLRWNANLKLDIAPQLSERMVQKIRKIIHTELVFIIAVLLCASMMAKGVDLPVSF